MFDVLIFNKKVPIKIEENKIICEGIILAEGSLEQLKEKLNYYKYYGLSTKEKILISQKIINYEN